MPISRRGMLIWLGAYLPIGAFGIWKLWNNPVVIGLVPAWLFLLIGFVVLLRYKSPTQCSRPDETVSLRSGDGDAAKAE